MDPTQVANTQETALDITATCYIKFILNVIDFENRISILKNTSPKIPTPNLSFE